MKNIVLYVAGKDVEPGSKKEIRLQISEYFTGNPVYIPVVVVHGAETGPKIFITAAIHGDEINGVEIIRRLITFIDPEKLRGTLFCVPIVNIFGFYNMVRNLPDGRDLNHHFPGSEKGSGASRIAYTLFNKVIKLCDYGIDIHTPRIKRYEIPHTEADLASREAHQLARSFGLPVIINIPGREKSLQHSANEAGIPTIVFSGGEVLRFHEKINSSGLKGIFNVLADQDMYDVEKTKPEYSIIVRKGKSIQTRHGGIIYVEVSAGDLVYKGERLARITSPFGREVEDIYMPETGLIISVSTNPLVTPGNEVCFYVRLDKSLPIVEKAFQKRKDTITQ